MAVLTQYNSQHLCGFLLTGVHASVAGLTDMRQDSRRWSKCCVSASVRQLLHLTVPRSHLVFILTLFFLSVGLLLCAGEGGLADTAVVLQVHWGQKRVSDRDGPRPFTPQAAREQPRTNRLFCTLLGKDGKMKENDSQVHAETPC